MEAPRLLVDLAFALAIALLGGLLAHRVRQPAMVGYILGGALVGPYGLGLVGEPAQVRLLVTVGLVLLLFALGVQFPLAELLRRLGVAEVVLPEFEASLEMLRHTLHRFGLSTLEIQHIISTLRQESATPPGGEP